MCGYFRAELNRRGGPSPAVCRPEWRCADCSSCHHPHPSTCTQQGLASYTLATEVRCCIIHCMNVCQHADFHVSLSSCLTVIMHNLCLQTGYIYIIINSFSYRYLLDSLGLWNERAQLDVIANDNKHAERPPQHIYIACNFCKKGITPYIQAAGRPRNPYARFGTGSANKSKVNVKQTPPGKENAAPH